MAHKYEHVSTGNGYWVKNGINGTRKQVITQAGEVVDASYGMKQAVILKPDVAVDSIVAAEDISAGGTIVCTLAKTTLDYPRNLLYTLTDDASTTLTGIFVTVGTDQFGATVTETTGTVTQATAVAGTQIFMTIVSCTATLTNAAASDTADVGVAIASDVASFGIPADLTAITDVKAINFVDNGASLPQNIDSTSIVLARNCFRPEQTVEVIDDYIIYYIVSRA